MGNLPGQRPTAYLGIKETEVSQLYFKDRAPTLSDYKIYEAGDIWINQTSADVYMMVKKVGTTPIWIGLTGSTGTGLETLTGDAGGAVPIDALFNINLLGSGGVSVTGNPAANTLTFTGSGVGMNWNEVHIVNETMAPHNGYITNNVARVNLSLPITCDFGSVFMIGGKGSGGWQIVQNAGQLVHFGNLTTTPGITGSISSTRAHDTCAIICVSADTEFLILTSLGNFTVL